MSLLSQRITEYISESGETVQALAEMGNINRTTLQRVKSGERLPTRAMLKKLLRVCDSRRQRPLNWKNSGQSLR